MAHRSRPTGWLLLCVVTASLLAGCSTGDSSADGGGSDSGDSGVAPGTTAGSLDVQELEGLGGVAGGVAGGVVGGVDGAQARTAARTAPLAREVIRTGEATLQAADVPGLRDEVGRLVDRSGGYVSSERASNDRLGRLVEDRLVLRIPSVRFEELMSAFEEVATVRDRHTKSDDVTTEVIDVDSRVRTAEVSLDRLRRFLRRSNDVNALIRLEAEMAEREADLASLRAQQDYLEDQTSLATVTVTLQRSPKDDPGDAPGDGGFLAGLSGGWDALTGVLVVTATLIGAVLPFALVAALVGVPVLLGVRAARRRRPAGRSATPASPV